uniref:small ribosomal subunit protein mS39 n=1 Tax=Myxine glutinosa TaxID=7769 RepID=UPI00358F7F9F
MALHTVCVKCGQWASRMVFWRFCGSAQVHETVTRAYEQAAARAPESITHTSVVLPQKKTWDKLAVLKALNSTITKDPTESPYVFKDDPYLIPYSIRDQRVFLQARESGKLAAEYVVRNYPNLFNKEQAEPLIPAFMPTILKRQDGEQDPLLDFEEHILMQNFQEAVDAYDKLLQEGTPVPLSLTNRLLDLLSYYGDAKLDHKTRNEKRWMKAAQCTWREDFHAERIFNAMDVKDARSYRALILGTVKHGAGNRALELFVEMQEQGLQADAIIFTGLLAAAPMIHNSFEEMWAYMEDLLKQMAAQDIRPNVNIFNTILNSLRTYGGLSRSLAMQTFTEMIAIGIEPSLLTYNCILSFFYRHDHGSNKSVSILKEILDKIENQEFDIIDEDDVKFFPLAMRLCLEMKELELAHRLYRFFSLGNNWKLLHPQSSIFFYGEFFQLICQQEDISVVLSWYRHIVPSIIQPTREMMIHLLRALDIASYLHLLPNMWQDIKRWGNVRQEMLERLLELMARDKQPPELQVAFAECAREIRTYVTGSLQNAIRIPLCWQGSMPEHLALLLLRANSINEAWEALQLCQTYNLVPSNAVLLEMLEVLRKQSRADLVVPIATFVVTFGLSGIEEIWAAMHDGFDLSPDQKEKLQRLGMDLMTSDSTSDSDSDSDSDSESDQD